MIRRWWQKHSRKSWAVVSDSFTETFFPSFFFFFTMDFFSSAGVIFTEYLRREELAQLSPSFHYSASSSEDLLVICTSRSEKRLKLCLYNYPELGREASRTEASGFGGWGCFCTAVLPARPFQPLQSETKQMPPLWSQNSLSPGLLFDS